MLALTPPPRSRPPLDSCLSTLDLLIVRLFENGPLIEHFRGPPYKPRSKIGNFSNTRVNQLDPDGMRPDLGFTSGGVKLFVLEDNADAAVKLLDEVSGESTSEV